MLIKFLLLLLMVIWAGSFPFIKFGLIELTPVNLAFWRFLVATPILFVYTSVKYKSKMLDFNCKEWLMLIFLGFTGVSLLYTVQFVALKYTTAINGSILINVSAIFIAILSFLLLNEEINAKKAFGITIGFIGIAIVISNGKIQFFESSTLIGDLLMLLDGLIWAGYTIVGKRLIEKKNVEIVTSWAFLFGTLTIIPFLAIDRFKVPEQTITWASILYMGLLCSIFGYLVWYFALEREEATNVAVYIYLIPLFTAVIAYFTLNEILTIFKAIGGFLTILGVYIVEKSKINTAKI